MNLLVIDCCMRGEESYTRRYCEAYLRKLNKDVKAERLYLCDEDLKPMTWDDVARREALLKSGDTDDIIFKYAKQFATADEVIIAAPYWDLSFPSLLKVYLERISVVGITFGYEGADCVGYCRAKKIRYFSSCGGYVDKHLGAEYVRKLGKMLGIEQTEEYIIQGMDIDPTKREEIINNAIERLQ